MGSFALSSSFEHEANKSGRTKHASAISNFDLGCFIVKSHLVLCVQRYRNLFFSTKNCRFVNLLCSLLKLSK